MDTELKNVLFEIGLGDYVSSFENNKVLNLQTLKQIQKVPFLLHELIKPIGDLAILLSRLEEIQKAENDHSEFSNTKNPNDFADPSLLNDDLLREINENYIVQPGCSQDILFHKTPSGNQQIIKSLLQSNSSKDIQIIEQTVQSELNWNQDTENIEKLVNSICSDKTEIVDNIGQPSCSRKRDKQTPRESKSKRVCKWIVSQEILQINLEDLLKNSSKGRTILQFYQQNKLLNSQSRSILIHIVGEKLLELNRNPSANDYEQVDTKIRQLFPSEPQFVYFIRAKVNGKNQKNHEGKLPNYIRNVKYRNAKLLHQEGVVDTEDSDEAEVNVESKVSNDVLNADGWLKENLEPWSEVEKKWKSTHHFRLNSLTSSENTFLPISQYYENYKVLRLVLGYTLLEADFELRYPNSVQALSSDWNLKQAALLKLIGLECHSAEIKDTIDNFKSFTNDEKDNLLFQLLPYLFPKQPKSRGKKSQSITPRPTQIESQEAFILHVKSPNDIDPAIMRRLNQMKKKEKLQPFILCVGTTRAKLSRSYCIIDTIKYEFPNLKKAFDVCFKAIFALHTEYSQEAYQPWLFVQQALYDIFTEYDKKSANISTMVGNFKTLVNIQRTTEIVNLEEH
ncbi:uncharacterized protein LOC127289334 [Leptopilina boulardi]|uniref:uncharacterized protein LOC127280999 n=1 Tax=Leptopilina boulardi TaxID=63433 RepID=UPI0021F5BAE2|nr:uncharacterized protein LOC127280999 [Leptopilina boulardi]XP_051161875.1 uncharacterized protein LOC127281927 [Leptopilina boulardi]XP_051163100.1 uncharacterized protein LOC127282709 [Leptopilina boulardi]XP_051164832.1 uncharacterized protein LOC127283782 [Leptopilina boulardi]XP_051171432.1 uncharacterized protein LOC127288170 [Leptopilina boulardi]XP_051173157.1 uncharacterized protein LOC127289334 [Leptopilina boulardi]